MTTTTKNKEEKQIKPPPKQKKPHIYRPHKLQTQGSCLRRFSFCQMGIIKSVGWLQMKAKLKLSMKCLIPVATKGNGIQRTETPPIYIQTTGSKGIKYSIHAVRQQGKNQPFFFSFSLKKYLKGSFLSSCSIRNQILREQMVITFDELTLYITVYITDVQYCVSSFKGFF